MSDPYLHLAAFARAMQPAARALIPMMRSLAALAGQHRRAQAAEILRRQQAGLRALRSAPRRLPQPSPRRASRPRARRASVARRPAGSGRMRPAREALGSEALGSLETAQRRTRGAQKTATKVMVSLRLDRDVIEKLRASGPGWQSRANDILRKQTLG